MNVSNYNGKETYTKLSAFLMNALIKYDSNKIGSKSLKLIPFKNLNNHQQRVLMKTQSKNFWGIIMTCQWVYLDLLLNCSWDFKEQFQPVHQRPLPQIIGRLVSLESPRSAQELVDWGRWKPHTETGPVHFNHYIYMYQ